MSQKEPGESERSWSHYAIKVLKVMGILLAVAVGVLVLAVGLVIGYCSMVRPGR